MRRVNASRECVARAFALRDIVVVVVARMRCASGDHSKPPRFARSYGEASPKLGGVARFRNRRHRRRRSVAAQSSWPHPVCGCRRVALELLAFDLPAPAFRLCLGRQRPRPNARVSGARDKQTRRLRLQIRKRDQPSASPAARCEPGSSSDDGHVRLLFGRRDAAWGEGQRRLFLELTGRTTAQLTKPVEVGRGRVGIDARCATRCVLSEVVQHVGKRVLHGAGRRQIASKEATSPQLAAPRNEPIHLPRHANGQALHAPRQRRFSARLDDQMHMVALHRKLQHAKTCPRPRRLCQSLPHGRKDELRAQ
jgi:hypothetical protein